MEQNNINFNQLFIFMKVIEYRSYSGASKALNIPKSTLSRNVSQLESDLGLQLLMRTTRQFQITEAGERLFQLAQNLKLNFEQQLDVIKNNKSQNVGKIKITAPNDLGVTVLNPLIIKFQKMFPHIYFDIHYTDEIVNIVSKWTNLAPIGSPQCMRKRNLI